MVAAVVGGQQPRRMAWVAQHLVEIDHRVELTAATDPRVDLLTHGLLVGREKADRRRTKERVLERRDRRSDDPNPVPAGARDQLTIAGDDALRAHAFRRRYERA